MGGWGNGTSRIAAPGKSELPKLLGSRSREVGILRKLGPLKFPSPRELEYWEVGNLGLPDFRSPGSREVGKSDLPKSGVPGSWLVGAMTNLEFRRPGRWEVRELSAPISGARGVGGLASCVIPNFPHPEFRKLGGEEAGEMNFPKSGVWGGGKSGIRGSGISRIPRTGKLRIWEVGELLSSGSSVIGESRSVEFPQIPSSASWGVWMLGRENFPNSGFRSVG